MSYRKSQSNMIKRFTPEIIFSAFLSYRVNGTKGFT